MKKHFQFTLWAAFALAGLVCIGIGLGLYLPKALNPNHVMTEGFVIQETNHNTEIYYKVDGQIRVGILNGTSSSYVRGKQISVYYDKTNVTKIGAPELDLLLLIPVIPGIVFSMMGGFGVVWVQSKDRRAARLKETGKRVWAKFEEVKIDFSYTVNGHHPYRIFCVWVNPVDGMEYHFKSDLLRTNPSFRIKERGISTFPVFLDEKNPKRYYVDTAALTENLVDLT